MAVLCCRPQRALDLCCRWPAASIPLPRHTRTHHTRLGVPAHRSCSEHTWPAADADLCAPSLCVQIARPMANRHGILASITHRARPAGSAALQASVCALWLDRVCSRPSSGLDPATAHAPLRLVCCLCLVRRPPCARRVLGAAVPAGGHVNGLTAAATAATRGR